MLAKIERERKEEAKKQKSSGYKSSSKSSTSSSHHRHKDHGSSRRHRNDSADKRRHNSSSRHKSYSTSSQEKKDKSRDKNSHKAKEYSTDKNTHKVNDSYKYKETQKGNEKEQFITELHCKDEEERKDKQEENEKGAKIDQSGSRSSSHRQRSKSSNSSHSQRHSINNKDTDNKSSSSSKRYKDTTSLMKSKDVKDKEKDYDKPHTLSTNKRGSSLGKDEGEAISKVIDSSGKDKGKDAADTSKLKGTVDDEDRITRKEVTAEDVAKAESLIKKITANSSTYANLADFDREGSEAVASLSSDSVEQIDTPANDSTSELVSSTVTIKTPDTTGLNVSSDSNPVVWKGDINMPDVAKFSVTAKQVSGTTDYLTVDLKEALRIVGRIAPQTVWDYVSQVSESPSKEILLVRLEPTTDDEKINYTSFFNYLQHRNR